MNGTITFDGPESLAAFLAALTGKTTATFEVHEKPNGMFLLEFTGGY